MNDIENMSFPTGPVISGVFGTADVMNASDIELQGMLDDIGFFEADEESMLLPMTEIKPATESQNMAASCVSPSSTPELTSLAKESLTPSTSAPSSAPVFVSSHDLVLSKQHSMPTLTSDQATTTTNTTNGMPVTISSSSVASKALPQPLAPPSYYLATNKFSTTAPAPLSSRMLVAASPTGSPRTVVSGTTTKVLPLAPATAALAALTSTSGEQLDLSVPNMDGTAKKRRLSDMSSQTWPEANGEEDEMEMKRERNRLHAKKSRLRKKSLTNTLEESLQILKAENTKLRESIYQVIGKAKTEAILEKRILDSHNSFIDNLKERRVVDKKTATFLRGLKRKMQAAKKKQEKRQLTLQKQQC